jgi:hypothetical protein
MNCRFLAVQHIDERARSMSALQESVVGWRRLREEPQQCIHGVWLHLSSRWYCGCVDDLQLRSRKFLLVSSTNFLSPPLPFQDHTGLFLAYVGMLLVSVLLFARTFYYRRMKVSVIEGPI